MKQSPLRIALAASLHLLILSCIPGNVSPDGNAPNPRSEKNTKGAKQSQKLPNDGNDSGPNTQNSQGTIGNSSALTTSNDTASSSKNPEVPVVSKQPTAGHPTPTVQLLTTAQMVKLRGELCEIISQESKKTKTARKKPDTSTKDRTSTKGSPASAKRRMSANGSPASANRRTSTGRSPGSTNRRTSMKGHRRGSESTTPPKKERGPQDAQAKALKKLEAFWKGAYTQLSQTSTRRNSSSKKPQRPSASKIKSPKGGSEKLKSSTRSRPTPNAATSSRSVKSPAKKTGLVTRKGQGPKATTPDKTRRNKVSAKPTPSAAKRSSKTPAQQRSAQEEKESFNKALKNIDAFIKALVTNQAYTGEKETLEAAIKCVQEGLGQRTNPSRSSRGKINEGNADTLKMCLGAIQKSLTEA